MDEFSEKFQRGGGSFSIQKFILQIFAIIDDTSVMNFRKNLQYNFPKNEGGGQWPFGTFPKIHPFWKGNASLNFVFHLIEPSLRREDGKLPVNASRNICFAESSGNKQYTYNKHMLKGFSKILLTEQYCSFLRITRY